MSMGKSLWEIGFVSSFSLVVDLFT